MHFQTHSALSTICNYGNRPSGYDANGNLLLSQAEQFLADHEVKIASDVKNNGRFVKTLSKKGKFYNLYIERHGKPVEKIEFSILEFAVARFNSIKK